MLPICVSIATMAAVAAWVDVGDTLDAARAANLPLALAAVAFAQLTAWFLVSLLMQRSILWFGGQLRLRDMVWVRGAGYLLMLLNSALGQAGLVLYQRGACGLGWPRLLGVVGLRTALSVASLTLFIWPGILVQQLTDGAPGPVPDWGAWLWLGVAGYGMLELFGSLWTRGHFGLSGRLLARLPRTELLDPLREAHLGHAVAVAGIFLPQIACTLVGYYVLSHAFGVAVPIQEFALLGPLLLILLDVPIAFSGFGSATLAWFALFGAHGTPAELTALSIFLPTARLLTRVVIGCVSLPFAVPRLRAAGVRWGRE